MAHLLAIAASPAGPAHSFMIGEALQAAATTLGHTLVLQVRSSCLLYTSPSPRD